MQFRKGQILEVVFLDHCTGATTDPVEFVVYGRLAHQTKDALTVAAWDYHPARKETAGNLTDSNRTTFVIMRSAIKSVRKMIHATQSGR